MYDQNHAFTYDEPIRVESVTQAVSDLALRFGEGADEEEATMVRPALSPSVQCGALEADVAAGSPQSRPFGVALLIAGCDENGPQL